MKKKLMAVLISTAMLSALMTGCGGEEAPDQTSDHSQESGQTPEEDTADQREETTGNTAEQGDKKWKIGFANIGEIVELQIEVKESLQRAADEAGVELVYMNNNMDGATAVQNADNMIQQEIDGFIEFNVDESVGPAIKEKMDAQGIPIIAVDIPIEGTVFFGANNETAGIVGGKHLGETAQERWGEEPDCLLLVIDSTSGETPLQRVRKMYDGMKEVFPDFSEDKIFEVDGGTDASNYQKVVSDFLSAHPNDKHIAIGCFHDLGATAAMAAIETAGREKDCIMVSENEYGYLDYIKANPEGAEDECWVGGVGFFFNRYGDYLIPAMVDILEGKDVGEQLYVEHEVITRENAETYFADYLSN